MEWESDSPCHSQTYPGKGRRSPGGQSGWELEFRDSGAIPGQGLLLTAERWIEGVWGRRQWWEMPVEESQAAMEARWCCWVTCRGGAITIASLFPQAKAGPSNTWVTELQSRTPARGPLYVPDELNNKDGPQAREPSKCLNGQSHGERQAKEAFWSPVTRGSKRDSDRAIIPGTEAVRVPAHLALPGSPQAKQLRHLPAPLSPGQSCHQQKRSSVYAHRVTSVVSDSLQPCRLWPARLLCQGGGFSRQEYWSVWANTGCHPLREHCTSCCPSHQLPWVPGAARTPVTQAAAAPPPLALMGQTQVLQGSLRSKPQWTTHMQRWK